MHRATFRRQLSSLAYFLLARLSKNRRPIARLPNNFSLGALVPSECATCREHLQYPNHCLCNGCIQTLPRLDTHCSQCAIPLASNSLCANCQKQPPAFRRCRAAFEYQQPISTMIKRIKTDPHAPELKQLSDLLADTILANYGPDGLPDIIIPVPLHWIKQLRRGFNQSQGISQLLSSKLPGSNIQGHYLTRTARGPAQHLQGRKQRLKGMTGAFKMRENQNITGRSVALVDDVVTTGATANAAAKTLLAAGANSVDIWCIARTGWLINPA